MRIWHFSPALRHLSVDGMRIIVRQLTSLCYRAIIFPVLCIVLPCIAIPGMSGCKARNTLPPGAGAEPALPPPPIVVPPSGDSSAGETATLSAIITAEKKTYARGQLVRFTLTVRNTGKNAQKLTFNSGQSFDITATPSGRPEPAWRWSHDKMFTMALRELTLKAGATQSWTATWEQTDNDGNPVPRGEYSIAGRIVANGGIAAPPLTITLSN